MSETLTVKNLYASYGKTEVLHDISFDIKRGEFLCICGPNGTGKSSLLSILSGIQTENICITSADIQPSIDDIIISTLKRKDCAKRIAFMLQNETSVWNFTVKDVVLSGRYPYSINGYYSKKDNQKVLEIINDLGIENLKERLIHSLSGGEFQKVRIARSLAQEPEFLLLDEPVSNLDLVYESKLMSQLKDIARKKHIGIVASIHDINLAAKYSDKILLLPPGKAGIFGNTVEVLNINNLKETYGVDFTCQKIESFQLLQ